MSEHILEKCPLECNQNQNCIFFNGCKRYQDYQQGRADQRKEDEELNYHYQTSHECYEQGIADERKKIMEIIDNADDIANAMYLLGQHFVSVELKENKK